MVLVGGIGCGAVILALGLGLGLGLSSGDDGGSSQPPLATEGCAVFPSMQRTHARDTRSTRSSSRHARSRTKRWLNEGECPDLGEPQCPEGFEEPPLLVVSLDGFRADYLKRGLTPTLQKLSECGVHAPYMRATFPTKTFPNHYTIMTGLFTESHGIIDNTMYDLEYSEQFLRGSTSFQGKWWGGEPMWLTSKRQGKKSATMFWPGSEANITGEYPDYCFIYDADVDYQARIDTVLGWLDLPAEERPGFITLYFDEPDATGHSEGPFFKEMDAELERMDGLISNLLDGLRERSLDKCINLIILADHGMGELFGDDKTVYLDQYLNISEYYIYSGVTGRISSKYIEDENGNIVETPSGESPQETLDKLECTHYNNSKDYYVRFYDKKDMPKRFHYANNRRIDDVVMELEDKWKVYKSIGSDSEMGSHGYDNTYKSMHALFMAYGPYFKQSLKIDPFDNIEVYNLMADILRINPSPNNGTHGRLHQLLHSPAPLERRPDAVGNYSECPFPDIAEDESGCTCDDLVSLTNATEEELDQRLNLTEEEQEAAISRHLPYGTPALNSEHVTACVLTQYDYVMGYSHTHNMALWSAFSMQRQEGQSVLDGDTRTDKYVPDCIRADMRVANASLCSDYSDPARGIVPAFLYPSGLGNTSEAQLDGHISSNLVPMYDSFRTGIWQNLLIVAEEYAEKYESINVVTGPLFDYNADGYGDQIQDIPEFVNNGSVPIPSHYYLSITRCDDVSRAELCLNSTHLMSVALLHRPTLSNCWDERPFRYMQENVIRLTDIESLTGLHFLTAVMDEQWRIILNTHLAVDLWPRISWIDLSDDESLVDDSECPLGYDSDHPPVLLISLDGFRPDYIQRNLTPTTERLTHQGVTSQYMRSIYPTMTFPNHYTISTGLYPESHGIVDNSMYDMELNQSFYLGSTESLNPDWWGGEPIWNTVELQGGTAMTFFWPGSDVEIGGIRPTEYRMYDGDVPYHERVDTTLEWLNGSTGVIPDLISLYFSNVDSAGHEGGPDSLLVDEALEKVDFYMKRLMDGLYRLRLHKCVNIITVSDHGMSDISCDRAVLAGDYLSDSTMDNIYMYPGTSSRIANEYKFGQPDKIQIEESDRVPYPEILSNLTCVNSNMSVFEKHMLPRRHHYSNNARIDDLVLVLNDRWQADRFEPWCEILGQHGWDPNFANLRAYFSAYGPAFKQRTDIEPFENIELYNLLALLTDVNAAPNNGTVGSMYHALKNPPGAPSAPVSLQYGDCDFPTDEEEYELRANATDCDCDIMDVKAANDRLNQTADEELAQETTHLSHGVPALIDNHTACILYHEDYVAGYSADTNMPIWSAFRLNFEQASMSSNASCIRPDVRVETSNLPNCSIYANETGLQPSYLFPPEFSSTDQSESDCLISSNIVPMWSTFKSGIWSDLLNLLSQWADIYTSLDIVLGPIFDYDADGIRDATLNSTVGDSDIPIPSHYYAIALRCDGSPCEDTMEYNTQAFVIPHQPNISNCMAPVQYLQDNIARIRDIELLTGLEFLTSADKQSDEVKLTAIRKRTFTQDTWW